MKSRTISKMGHVGSKTRSLGQIIVRMFVFMKSRTIPKIGHVKSKTKSLGQILEKPCVRYRRHIFSPIMLRLGQNGCLDEISNEFENGSCRVKN